MPRESKQRTTIRAGSGESQVRAPSASINAGRLYIQNPYVLADRSKANGLKGISNAAAGLGRTIAGIAEKKRIEDEKKQYARGQAKAMTENTGDLEYFAKRRSEIEEQDGKAFARGYSAQAGRANAYLALGELKDELAVRGDLITDEDFDRLLKGKMDEHLNGIEDDDYIQQALDVFGNNEASLREGWRKNQQSRALERISIDFNAALRNDMRTLADNDGSVEDLHTTMRTYYDQGYLMGLTRENVNEMIFENVAEVAETTERPELMDVFEIASPSTEDPEKTIPGLANSPAWQAKIQDKKDKIERAIETKKSVRDQELKYAHGLKIQEAIANEDWSKAEQLADAGVKSKTLTASEALTYRKTVLTERKKAEKLAMGKALIFGGKGYMAATADLSESEMQDSLDGITDDMYESAGQDPAARAAATDSLASLAVTNGKMPSIHKQLLNTASPTDPGQWALAYDLRNRYRAISPQFAKGQIADRQDIMFDMYEDMLERNVDPASAASALTEMADPERAERVLNSERRTYLATIKNELETSGASKGAWDLFDNSTVNGAYTRDFIEEGALLHIANTGASPERAIAWSIQKFQSTHSVVRGPDGDQYWAYHAGHPLPAEFDSAQQELSDAMSEKWKDDVVNQSKTGYYLSPNPINPTSPDWIVRKIDDGTPVVIKDKGKAKPLVMNRHKLMTDYFQEEVAEEALSREELQARHDKTKRRASGVKESRRSRRRRNKQ